MIVKSIVERDDTVFEPIAVNRHHRGPGIDGDARVPRKQIA
jgi:hypothetical protein